LKKNAFLIIAAAGAAYVFLFRKNTAAAGSAGPGAGGAGGVSYVPRLSTPESSSSSSKKTNPLLSNLASSGANLASSVLSALLGKGKGGGGGGGASFGGGSSGVGPSRSSASSSSSLEARGGQVNQPAIWTDPATGNNYDLWSGELLSGPDPGQGIPYTPEAAPSSVDVPGDPYSSGSDYFSGEYTGGDVIDQFTLPGGDFAGLDSGGGDNYDPFSPD